MSITSPFFEDITTSASSAILYCLNSDLRHLPQKGKVISNEFGNLLATYHIGDFEDVEVCHCAYPP